MKSSPNIILLMADDHRYESIGANGNRQVHTPHIDALCAAGVVFDGAHCQGSMHPAVCVPSRASLMTGRNIFASSKDPTGQDYEGLAFAIPESLPTFPEMLRKAGYHTHAIGKWHNDRAAFARSFASGERLMFGGMSDHDRVPLHRFDASGQYRQEDVHFEPGLSTDLFGDSAERFLRGYSGDGPFFLQVAFTAPHDPRTPPPDHEVPAEGIEPPANFAPMHPFDNGEMLVRDELLETFPRPPRAIAQHLADYYGMIGHLDAAVGSIVSTLDDLGLREETIVIYTADHGLALGQHGLLGKQNLYEHSLRIPLVLSGTGLPRGRRVRHLVWHADTTATILDLAGLAPPPGCEGTSLLPAARGDSDEALRATATAAYGLVQRMARDDRYKLICYFEHPGADLPSNAAGRATRGSRTEQLFDLQEDPGETVNLACLPEMQPVRQRLLDELLLWQDRVDDPLAAVTREALRRA